MAVARDELDVNVKHTFIDPLQDLHNMELKDIRVRRLLFKFAIRPMFKQQWIRPEGRVVFSAAFSVQYQLKKMDGRRLDLDYKRRRSGKVPAEEVRQAWDKFITSKELAERSMFVLLQNDVSLGRIHPD